MCYILIAGVNYERLISKTLTFDSNNNAMAVPIAIHVTNDSVVEVDEEFFVSLSYSGEDDSRVAFEPQNATVAIFEVSGEGITRCTL